MTKAKKIKYSFFMICLLIMLVILAMVLSGPSKNIKDSVYGLKEMSNSIRAHYQNRPGYWGLNTDVVIKNKIIPEKMIQTGKIIMPVGAVLIGNGPDGEIIMPGAKSFDIIYKNLNAKDCVNMTSFKLGDNHYLGLISIKIINRQGENAFNWGGENEIPISGVNARKACSDKNDIIWSYE